MNEIINFLGSLCSISSFFKKNDKVAINGDNVNIDNVEKKIVFSDNEFNIVKQENTDGKEIKKTNFSKRLFYVIDEINKNRNDDTKITISEICKSIGEDSVNIINQDFEPKFEIYNKVAELLGINKEWFNDGIKQPFYLEDSEKDSVKKFIYSNVYTYKEYNNQYNIIINKDNLIEGGNQHNALIIQKKDKYKYFILYDDYRPFELLNPCPNNNYYSGCTSALRFCDLIYYLKQKQWEGASNYKTSWVYDSSFHDRVYFVDNECFERLIKGEIFIEEILYKFHSEDEQFVYMLFEKDVKESDYRISMEHKEWFFQLKSMIDRMSKM